MPCREKLKRAFKRKRKLDPADAPKPIDIHGYDGLCMVRLVPSIDQLIEVQVTMPGNQWEDILEVVKTYGKDVEIDEENGRIVRRGKDNKATNVFIDKE